MQRINGIAKWMTYTSSIFGMLAGLIEGKYGYAAFAFTTFIWCFLYNDSIEKKSIWQKQKK
jgi:hypothetical protein